MLFLTATTETLTLVTSGAYSTDWLVSYVTMDSTTGATAGTQQGNVATATTITIVPAPPSTDQNQVKLVSIINKDATNTQIVAINKVTGAGTYSIIRNVSLGPNETLRYIDTIGWQIFDINGVLKATSVASAASSITGGTINQIPYQSGPGVTTFFSASNYGIPIYGATGVPSSISGASGVLQGSGSAIPTFTTTPTLTGTNFTGIPNGGLTNSSVTIGSTAVSLGATVTTFAGLVSVSSTGFTGALTGNATSATNMAGGAANGLPYQTGSGATAFLAQGTGVLAETAGAPSWTTTPTLTGTNFTGIPNTALTNYSLTIGTTNVALGGTAATINGLIAPGITGSANNAVAAAGTTQGTATVLAADTNVVTSGTGGVIAQATVAANKIITVINHSGSSINLYPASGHSFDTNATNAAIAIPNNGFIELVASSTTSWNTSYQAITQGTYVIGAVTTASNIAAGAANQIAYQTGVGATGYVTAPTTASTVLTWNGSAFVWNPSSGSLSSVTAATTSATIANANFPIVWNWAQTTASQTAFTFGETSASTGGAGSQVLLKIGTLAASTSDVLQVQARGTDAFRISSTGAITATAGSVAGAAAPIITITGGISNAAQSGNSGGIVLLGGAAGAVASIAGGPIVIAAGAGSTTTTGGIGGAISITAGTGGLALGGGNLTLAAGAGGATGTGGALIFTTAATTSQVERFRILNTGDWSVGSTGTAVGTSGWVLTSAGPGAPPTWASAGGGGSTVANDTTTNATYYPVFSTITSGTLTTATISTSKLNYNPSTGMFGAYGFTSLSDRRAKTNIKPLVGYREVLTKLSGVRYDTLDGSSFNIPGFIAQRVEKYVPELVGKFGIYKSLNYSGIIPFLVEGWKDHDKLIFKLLKRIEALEAKIKDK